MRFLLTTSEINTDVLNSIPFKISNKTLNKFSLLVDDEVNYLQSETFVSITEGYLRDLKLQPNDAENNSEKVIQREFGQWPFSSNITGSFSSTLIDKIREEIVLCNDILGPYPLYYLQHKQELFISNSIVLMGIVSKCKFDEAGIIQRCFGPEFSNIGSRTILENCKRLLPGEWLKFDTLGNLIDRKYDNTLYQSLSSPRPEDKLYNNYWKALKKEMVYCLTGSRKINIALSGGIDSRIVLGSIPDNKEVNCLTFGGDTNYETKVASRLAKIKNASFKNFCEPNLYFPEYKILKKYTEKTEALYLGSWLEILENTPSNNEPIITGDLTTALSGRNIKNFSSKKQRQKDFINHYILNKEYSFNEGNKIAFENWKKKVKRSYLHWYNDQLLSKFNCSKSQEELVDSLNYNLNELFSRIEAHNLPYQDLYDELFTWYTHTRTKSAKQILICRSNFHSIAPAMSLQVLRNASNIHPNLRLNFRFLNKLFQKIPELNKFNKVPTSQVPLIPQYFPNFIKFPIWGLRAKVDSYLIKRLLKSKEPSKRYRLFESINWVRVYQNPEMERNLKSYFQNNHLGDDYFQMILAQSISRKKLESWPLANMEALSVSSLNIELEIIKSHREEI